jgi:4-amino-4-deoxy-L-arabinose transferase-like glycosyltransferase
MRRILSFVRPCSHRFPLYITVFLLVSIPYVLRLWLLETRHFDQDEFEHLHGAWLISKGLLPYRDYFEHHTPLFHFILAPFYNFFDVETKVSDAFGFLFFARQLAWFLTGIILLLTFWLGKLWRDTRVAFVSALFLTNAEIFLATTLEIRPDQLAVMCLLACLVTLISAVRLEITTGSNPRWYFAWSGVFLGAGIMATQKLLFALPGLAVAMFLYILNPVFSGTRRLRLRNCGYQVAGVCVPIFLTLGYFYLQNGLVEFVRYTVFFNLGFKERFAPYHRLHILIFDNPYLALLGSVGLIQFLLRIVKRDFFLRADFILVPSTLGLIVGLFIIPVAYSQYYLLFLPLAAVVAGAFLIEIVDKVVELREHVHWRQWILRLAQYSLAVLIFLSLISLGVGSDHPFLVTAYWFGALAVAMVLLWRRIPTFALMFFLVALSIPPLKRMHGVFGWHNTDQLDAIRYVSENTAPTDTVMDGFSGYGVFRPHAYFYFFPHQGIQLMLTAEDRHELLEKLQSGRIAPKLILFDKYLENLSPAVTAFLKEHYQPVGTGDIWRRKERA